MEKILREILKKALIDFQKLDVNNIDIEIPSEGGFGDFATPIPMRLARVFKKNPRTIANEIIQRIDNTDIFERIEVAGPGYINFTFSKKFLINELQRLLSEEKKYLFEDIGRGRKIQIEFVSANPTGPLHLGHGRGAAVGAALANLLSAVGYKVDKEYYINDAGRQVQLLGLSVRARYRELLGIDSEFPPDGYRGEYINDLAEEFLKSGDSENNITDFAYKRILSEIKQDLADFGITYDTWQSERQLFESNQVTKAIEELRDRQYIYEKDGAIWFNSSVLGDDKDRVVIKRDGEFTYFATDIAYHRNKIERGYDEIINIWGADHHGYIQRIKAVIKAFGYPSEKLKVLLVQMVTLSQGGTPIQMSKRTGQFITLRELINEIGSDTTKFIFLTRRHDSHLDIDIENAKKESRENPVYYVQYAHARINSIFNKVFEKNYLSELEDLSDLEVTLFSEDEFNLIRKVLISPLVFKNAAIACEPHRITFYIQELASLFHTYYQKYRVITDDPKLTKARLAVCESIRIVLKYALEILGV
ncbi:MAG: arginine--tRNA ligase, partial [Thermodesulfovibrionales bacterium]|nr:arginine--tRNA ligase [Thermodesulfovibrionales bacterium]